MQIYYGSRRKVKPGHLWRHYTARYLKMGNVVDNLTPFWPMPDDSINPEFLYNFRYLLSTFSYAVYSLLSNRNPFYTRLFTLKSIRCNKKRNTLEFLKNPEYVSWIFNELQFMWCNNETSIIVLYMRDSRRDEKWLKGFKGN